MPKQVDHVQRRREILDALFRVAERGGLASATYRTIASEAGIKAPQVQYYFPTRAEMLDAAIEELGRRIVQRGMALIAQLPPNASPAANVRAAVRGAYPADPETRRNTVLFYQVLLAALADESLAETGLVAAQRMITESFAEALRAGQADGTVASDRDALHEARIVLFANTGLMLAALLGIYSVEQAQETMEYHLDRLMGPAPNV